DMISLLDGQDALSILPFSYAPNWAAKELKLERERSSSINIIDGLFADGGTALYDSISTAYKYLQDNSRPNSISAIVVLTDGADTNSRMSLRDLIDSIRLDSEKNTIHVFTIGYGQDAVKEVLKSIADATQAKFYEGNPENIQSVFREISTFF